MASHEMLETPAAATPKRRMGLLGRLKRRRKLRRQANADYENARGTAHLTILQQAHTALLQKKRDLDRTLPERKQQLINLEHQQQQALDTALAQFLVTTRLTEVDGIGQRYRNDILRHVFRTSLDDLHYAYHVHGISRRRQANINAWVASYKRRWSQLKAQDFPGKTEINAGYQGQQTPLRKQIEQLTEQQQKVTALLQRLATEIASLSQIKRKDFIRAALHPERDPGYLETYLRGCFAEWEPVPEWFKEAISYEVSRP
ncbi:MAG: hypothetical protein JXB35_17715 [Anaerolineae bacterium]|nr:hypothetical protein [Anaerolineae bacterium]